MIIERDFACNTNGWMTPVQLYQADSGEQTDMYISLFAEAVADGFNPCDDVVKSAIQDKGTLRFDELLPHDQERLTRAVEQMIFTEAQFY